MPSLEQIVAALADQGVSPREAQRLLAAHLRRSRRRPVEESTADRARRERLEWAEDVGLYEDHHLLADTARMSAALGWDIAPPPELE